jgi:hypothetical protein
MPVTTASKVFPEWITAELIGKLVSESMNFMRVSCRADDLPTERRCGESARFAGRNPQADGS